MAFFSFYNMRKPRQYEHKPIYYDPRKENLEKRIHKVKVEMGIEEEDPEKYKETIKGSFIEGTSHLKKSKNRGDDIRERVNKNMRLLLAVVILGVLFWYLYIK